jgi:hypothetical protein
MEYIDTTKSVLENLYYLSGILILISIAIGLFQLSIAKTTLNINSQREAAKLAVNQIDIYMTQIIPLQNKLYQTEKEKNISKIKLEIGDFNSEFLTSKMGKEEFIKSFRKRIPISSEVISVLNVMEAFSVYFVKGIADEEIGFSSIGTTFIHSVENLYFDIASYNYEKTESFQNLIKLYEIWSKKKQLINLQTDRNIILEKILKLNPSKLKSIGTK